MGTSANLWVKSNGKHFVQHTSYDGHPDNVMGEIGCTVAACGLDALRQSINRAVIANDDGDMDQTRHISVQISLSKYFDACQERNKEPANLLSALRYPYGTADFAHGGALVLMGSPIVHDDGFCQSENEADFVLDLDAGHLFVPQYQGTDPNAREWTLDLNRIQDCDPVQVAWAFSGIDLHYDDPVQTQNAVDECLALAESGQAPEPQYHNMGPRGVAATETEFDEQQPDAVGSNEKASHQFVASGHDAIAIRLLIGLLQRAAHEAPALARPTALMAAMEPDANNEISLTVDFSDGFASAAQGKATHALIEQIGRNAGQVGMAYRFSGGGVSQMFSGSGIASVISVGSDMDEDAFDDDEFADFFGPSKIKVPENAAPVRTMDVRHADIAEDVSIMDQDAKERLELEKFVARTNLDYATLSLIPDSIVLSPEKIKQSNSLMQILAPLEDAARPGARRARFLGLPQAIQSQILESFGNLGRYVLCEELGISRSSASSPSPRP